LVSNGSNFESVEPNSGRWDAAGVIGSLIWIFAISNLDKIQEYLGDTCYWVAGGYVNGFLIAFSGYLFWEILKGRAHKFVDDTPGLRWFSYFIVFAILLFGAFAFYAQNFGTSVKPIYIIGSILGGLVFSVALLPLMERLERH